MLNLIDHLPRTSYFAEAIAGDEDLAQRLAELPEGPPAPPRWSEFSPEVEQLMTLNDRMAALTRVQIVNVTRKAAPKIEPIKRPTTALQRARQHAGRARVDALAALIVK